MREVNVKPPLGVAPSYVVYPGRIKDLAEAIARRIDREPPIEAKKLVDDLNDMEGWAAEIIEVIRAYRETELTKVRIGQAYGWQDYKGNRQC